MVLTPRAADEFEVSADEIGTSVGSALNPVWADARF
jgi:hypothetical protein